MFESLIYKSRVLFAGMLTLLSLQCFSQTDSTAFLSDSVPPKIQISDSHIRTVPIYAVPAMLVGYGFTSLGNGITQRADKHIRHELLEEYPGFTTRIDDKLQYAPAALTYLITATGVKSKNSFFDRTAMYLISNSLMGLSVNFLKTQTAKLRPSGSDRRSFPSGHTATAFVSAEFMRQELGDQSQWYGYIGYSMATATGALRMMKNQHWLSDVLAGAGIGIISTKITYLAYPWIKKKILKNQNLNFVAVPLVQNRTFGFSLVAPL